MPGVTISAGYGAGGSLIAPRVATLLGLPLLDRAISSHVAAQLRVSVQEAEGGLIKRSLPDRFLAVLAPLAHGALGAGTDCAPPRIEDVDPVTARKRLPEVDRARAQYVRRLYSADIDDPAFYQLQIDTTA